MQAAELGAATVMVSGQTRQLETSVGAKGAVTRLVVETSLAPKSVQLSVSRRTTPSRRKRGQVWRGAGLSKSEAGTT
jgi:hypothetical protein